MRAIYTILKKVKAGENAADLRDRNTKKTVRTGNLIPAVATAIEENRLANIRELAKAHGATYGTVSHIIHDSLGLVKKSARKGAKTALLVANGGEGEDLHSVSSSCSRTSPMQICSTSSL